MSKLEKLKNRAVFFFASFVDFCAVKVKFAKETKNILNLKYAQLVYVSQKRLKSQFRKNVTVST